MTDPMQPITDPQRLRALAHPLRWKLIKLVGGEETATATRCAEVLGESVASCSYHLNMLAKYGFVEQAEGGQGREKPWKLTSRKQTLDSEGLDDDAKLAVEAASEAFLEAEFAEIKSALRREDTEPKDWREFIGVRGTAVWVTAAEAKELHDQLSELLNRFGERVDQPELRPEGARQARLLLATYVSRQHPGR